MFEDPENNPTIDKMAESATQGRDRNRKRRDGRGSTGQGRETAISRALSKLLRHKAESAGLRLDGEGYAPLDRVVRSPPIILHRR